MENRLFERIGIISKREIEEFAEKVYEEGFKLKENESTVAVYSFDSYKLEIIEPRKASLRKHILLYNIFPYEDKERAELYKEIIVRDIVRKTKNMLEEFGFEITSE